MSTMKQIVAMIFVLVTSAYGQTIDSVSADPDFGHGATITLSTTGAGTRTLEDLIFETWDWGVDESSIDTVGSDWVTLGADNDPPRFCDGHLDGVTPRGNRSGELYVRTIIPDRNDGSTLNEIIAQEHAVDIDYGDKFYFSCMISGTYVGAQEHGIECPQQWKILNPLTHYGITEPSDPLGTPLAIGVQWNAAGNSSNPPLYGAPQIWVRNDYDNTPEDVTGNSHVQHPRNEWFQARIQYQLASAHEAADGTVEAWIDDVKVIDETNFISTGSDTMGARTARNGYVYDTVVLRNYVAFHIDEDCRRYIEAADTLRTDDCVVQVGSFGRVELGRYSDYALNKHLEYQQVTSWSDTEIVFTLNAGDLTTGETGYLFFTDDDGDVSSPMAIEIDGATPTVSAPGTPTGTRTGDQLPLSWTAASPAATQYLVFIKENDVLKRAPINVAGSDTSITATVSSSAALRIVVWAINSINEVQGVSGEYYIAAP